MKLFNAMEEIVFQTIDGVLAQTGCCTCQICRVDVAALTLNALPCCYVVSDEGAAYVKLKDLTQQFHTDVLSAVAGAAMKVKARPRHPVTANEL